MARNRNRRHSEGSGECYLMENALAALAQFFIRFKQTFGAKASHDVQMICGVRCALQLTNFASEPAPLRTKRPEGPYVYLVLSSGSNAF